MAAEEILTYVRKQDGYYEALLSDDEEEEEKEETVDTVLPNDLAERISRLEVVFKYLKDKKDKKEKEMKSRKKRKKRGDAEGSGSNY